MKKAEMIDVLAQQTELTKSQVEKVFNGIFDLFKEELKKGNDVSLMGFGTFKVKEKPAKTCRNPRTGESIPVPAHKAVSFSVGKGLKDAVK